MDQFRQAEDAHLSSYGWTDKAKGTVHIPIDQAIKLMSDPGIRQSEGDSRGAGESQRSRNLILPDVMALAQVQPPQLAPNIGIEQRLNEKIPLDLVFRDEQGKAVALRDFFGDKPVILVLAYYRCPRLCSLGAQRTGGRAAAHRL